MNHLRLTVLILLAVGLGPALWLAGVGAQAPATQAQMTEQQKLNYTLGYVICRQLQRREIEVEPQAMFDGFRAALDQAPPVLNAEQMRQALESVVKHQQTRASPDVQSPSSPSASGQTPDNAPARPTRIVVSDPYIDQADLPGFNLRINTQIDTAVPATRKNTLEGDNPNLIR